MAESINAPRHYALSVSGHPLSANARRRSIWQALYRDGKTYRDAVAWQARTLVAGARPLRGAHVAITLIYTRRPFCDPDNAVARCKPLLDGLVSGGLLVDDGADHVTLEVRQEVGLARRVQMEITEWQEVSDADTN